MLIDRYPERLKKGHIAQMQYAFQDAATKVGEDYHSFIDQLYPESATWGLVLWEAALGLASDISKPIAFRRERVQSKLRGQGITTAQMIQNVAVSFSNGEVEVIENPGDYRFDIKFVGTRGIPANLAGLTAAIEEIKPAHLAFDFIYTYATWCAIENYARTWDKWEAMELTWDAIELS